MLFGLHRTTFLQIFCKLEDIAYGPQIFLVMSLNLILMGFMFLIKKKNFVSDLLEYAKGLSCEEVKILEESKTEECLNMDSNAPAVHQLMDDEIIQMALNPEHGENDER